MKPGADFDGWGSSGEEACGARVEAGIAFSGDTIIRAEIRAQGASTAIAAAAELEARIRDAGWRHAAAVGVGDIIDAVTGKSGSGGQRGCAPERAAFFAVDALHRALEDALRRETFPVAGDIRDDGVLVAMSGGVDSSTACLIEHDAGSTVTGVTMRQWSDPGCETGAASCCSPESVESARSICHQLGIPHITVDCVAAFESSVVEYFVQEYLGGMTPNPCTWCNGRYRFPLLDRIAGVIGAARVATGHYARIAPFGQSRPETLCLARGRDQSKDQSYMLWGIPPELLSRIEFPLGELEKAQTRALAAAAGLATHERPDSQEICFIPDDDYRRFLRARVEGLPGGGDIVDADGNRLGRHDSIIDYTIGQRRGLGISSPAPLYVLRIETGSNTVVVGSREELAVTRVQVDGINAFVPLADIGECEVQLRYNSAPYRATVTWSGQGSQARAQVTLAEPACGVAPGQSAVMYRDELVLAGGVIASTRG